MPEVPFVPGGPSAIDQQLQAWQRTLSTDQYDAVASIGPYWATLSDGDKARVLRQLQHQASIGGNLTTFIQQLSKQPTATTPTPGGQTTYPTGSPAASQQQGTSAATAAVTGTLGERTTGGVAPGIAVPSATGTEPAQTSTGAYEGNAPPTGFNEVLQTYYQDQFVQAGGDVNALAQLAGVSPQNLQSQYQAYYQGWNKAMARLPQGAGGTPLSMQAFAEQKAQSMMGPWAAVLSAINSIWQGQMGSPMPAALQAQIITGLNAMPNDQKQTVLYNAYQYMENAAQAVLNPNSPNVRDIGGTLTGTLLSSLPSTIGQFSAGSSIGTGSVGTVGIVGTYAQLNPSATLQEQKVQQDIASSFQQALNRAPTAADLAALGSAPTPLQIQQYIDNQPVPGTGMNYGAYSTATGRLDPLWQEYFGKNPTPAELQWSIGQTPTDIQNFINNSASKVPGMTIGKYQDYSNELQTIQGDLPVAISDDFMKGLHESVTKK